MVKERGSKACEVPPRALVERTNHEIRTLLLEDHSKRAEGIEESTGRAPQYAPRRPCAFSAQRQPVLNEQSGWTPATPCHVGCESVRVLLRLANIFLVSPVLMSDRQRHIHSDVTRCCDGAPSRICGGVVRILEEPHGDKLRRQTGPCDRRRDIAAASAAPRCTTSIEI